MDQIFAQTRTTSFKTDENGEFILVDPGLSHGLIITDIGVTLTPDGEDAFDDVDMDKGFDLILQMGDGINRYEIADLDVERIPYWQYKSTGLALFWNGGRFEVLKNFSGKLTVTVSYIKLSSRNWLSWLTR